MPRNRYNRGRGWYNDKPQHQLAGAGIPTKAKGKKGMKSNGVLSDVVGEEVTDEDVADIVKGDILPEEGKWYNYGDVNFKGVGGVTMKRENGYITMKDVRLIPLDMSVDIAEGEMKNRASMLYGHAYPHEVIQDEYDIDEDDSEEELRDLFEEEPIYDVSEQQLSIERLKETMNEDAGELGGGVWSYGDVANAGSLKDMISWWLTASPSYGPSRQGIMTDIDDIVDDFDRRRD